MYCQSCGKVVLDDATFCGHCGAETINYTTATGSQKAMLTRDEWLDEVGEIQAGEEINTIKTLTNVTVAILFMIHICMGIFVCMCLWYIKKNGAYLTAFGLINDVIDMYYSVSAGLIFIVLMVFVFMSVMLLLTVVFGLLGASKCRMGYSIAYSVLGALYIILLLGVTLYGVLFVMIMSVPFVFIIVMQFKINNKYKQYLTTNRFI